MTNTPAPPAHPSDTPTAPMSADKAAKRQRIKPYLTAAGFNALARAGRTYGDAVGRPVSQSALIRRAVELIAARANEMQADEAIARSEAAALCRNEGVNA